MKKREFNTCFLFAKHLDAEGCLSLCLNASGEVDAPLEKRTAAEILRLQENAKTIVVLPTSFVSLHRLTLPWLSERKAREAIPFALEDAIAQSVSEVHFAFDKVHYINGEYLVVAMDTALLSQYIGLLDELDIDFDSLTIDWFALRPGEVFVTEDRVLINTDSFKGALSINLALKYLNDPTLDGFLFQDSAMKMDASHWTTLPVSSDCFVARRLLTHPLMNLCQGDFKHHTHRETTSRWYHASALLFGLWLVSILCTNGMVLHRLKSEDAVIQEQISTIYHVFFPEAIDVVTPRFRIEQTLKDQASGRKGDLWYVLGPLVKAVDETDGINIDEWLYENKIITIHLSAKNFAVLETFEKYLNKMNIDVKQNSAASAEKGGVTAVLELQA